MKLHELLKETDVLTYINALKTTQAEIKEEVSEIEKMSTYTNEHVNRVKRLVKKADNQYRVIAKLSEEGSGSFANNVSIQESAAESYAQIMKEVDSDE